MKIAALGMWHLGLVTAGCLAKQGHEVLAIEEDSASCSSIVSGQLPVSEPGLDEVISGAVSAGRLKFSDDFAGIADAEVIWITIDTPVDENDKADIVAVEAAVRRVLPFVRSGARVVISSQVPVGFTTKIASSARESEGISNDLKFFYVPENLRLGNAVALFEQQDRIIVGSENGESDELISKLLEPLTEKLIFMSLPSAEMVKHSLNAFFALSIAYINEIGAICESVGADAREVSAGLLSESRIGTKAYLKPGSAFAGGTLARDVAFLSGIADSGNLSARLIKSIASSNNEHKLWPQKRLLQKLGTLAGKTVAILGLTYKPGTDTLRRSSSVELCRWLTSVGAKVQAFDPAVKSLPAEIASQLELRESPQAALAGASAAVVATEWPEFQQLTAETFSSQMITALVLDPNGHLRSQLESNSKIDYLREGLGSQIQLQVKQGKDMPSLTNRSAIITGASQGLGKELAREFVKQGANVVICARDGKLLNETVRELSAIEGAAGRVHGLNADVSDPKSVDALVRFAIDKLGKIDVLLNNAGIYGPKGAVEDVDWDEWTQTLAINLYGPVLMCRAVLPHLKKQGGGKIINLSGGGATAPMPNLSAYATSKAALVRFTETLAEETKSFDIDVNAVAPGALNTRLLEEILQAGPDKVGADYYNRAVKQKNEGGAPLSRAAELCVYLASEASKGISGRLISAIWDPWENLQTYVERLKTTDIYTLRRILPSDRGEQWG